MKIAIFHLGFFYSGGGEKLVLEEMRGLRALGHSVDIFAPFVDRTNCFPDIAEMAEVKALLPPPPRWLPMKDPLWVLIACLVIPFLAPRFKEFDIFIGANQPGPWLAFISSKMLGKPYVIYLAQALRLLHPRRVDEENGIRIREGDHRFLTVLKSIAGPILNWADRTSISHARVVLTNGEHVSRWIRQVYDVDDLVCPAGCHPVDMDQLAMQSRWNGTVLVNGIEIPKPYILLSNRHAAQKRFEYAMWAIKGMVRRGCRAPLVITGQETTYTDQLRYLAKVLRIDELVHFVGLASEDDLSTLYREAALYVYPSPEEDFGMGIVESMGAGTPVVAWRNGGPAHIIVDRVTGYLIEPYDTDSFTDAMFNLASNPQLAERFGQAAYERANRVYSYDRHMRILESALRVALDENEIFNTEHAKSSSTHSTLADHSIGFQELFRGREIDKSRSDSNIAARSYPIGIESREIDLEK